MNVRPIHRIISEVIDLIIIGLIDLLVVWPTVVAYIDAVAVGSDFRVFVLMVSALISGSLVAIITSAYFLVLPAIWKGQTFGRRFARIAVVMENGETVNFKTLFLREVIGWMFISLTSFGLSILFDLFLVTIGPKKRSFSDMLAQTKLIDVL